MGELAELGLVTSFRLPQGHDPLNGFHQAADALRLSNASQERNELRTRSPFLYSAKNFFIRRLYVTTDRFKPIREAVYQ